MVRFSPWQTFGLDFLFTEKWNPVTEKFGALAPIYGTLVTSTIAMLIGVPVSSASHSFSRRSPLSGSGDPSASPSSSWPAFRALSTASGLVRVRPLVQATVQPFLIDTFANVPLLNQLFAGPPYGIGMLTAGLILAIMVLPFITSITREVFETVPPV
jgi:phosphate transport system permease protein